MKIFTQIIYLFVLFVIPGMGYTYGQGFARDVVGSSGTYATSTSASMAWTIGEVTIETYSSPSHFLTQGFHQPDQSGDVVVLPKDFFIPEGFSPNDDGINDLFVIRGVDMYPKNSINIYNRWGNKVFEANPYTSTWDGKTTMGLNIGTDELPVGTYFYVFDFGNTSKMVKGTIYLNR